MNLSLKKSMCLLNNCLKKNRLQTYILYTLFRRIFDKNTYCYQKSLNKYLSILQMKIYNCSLIYNFFLKKFLLL